MYSYGIDLGTTYSCIARTDGTGNTEVIKNIEGKNITPSIVEFISPTEIVVGETAKGDAILSPDNVVLYIKRSMGKKYQFMLDGKAVVFEDKLFVREYILGRYGSKIAEMKQLEAHEIIRRMAVAKID